MSKYIYIEFWNPTQKTQNDFFSIELVYLPKKHKMWPVQVMAHFISYILCSSNMINTVTELLSKIVQ